MAKYPLLENVILIYSFVHNNSSETTKDLEFTKKSKISIDNYKKKYNK